TAGRGASVCLQRKRSADRRAGLPNAVARRHRSAYGLDLECDRWMDHQQHGNRAQHQRKGRCLCVGAYATDPRHLQLLCALGPEEENGCRTELDRDNSPTLTSVHSFFSSCGGLRFLRMDSPRISMRWALCTRQSRMESGPSKASRKVVVCLKHAELLRINSRRTRKRTPRSCCAECFERTNIEA